MTPQQDLLWKLSHAASLGTKGAGGSCWLGLVPVLPAMKCLYLQSLLVLACVAGSLALPKSWLRPFVRPGKGQPRDVHQTLTPENGLNRGDWGPVELCPPSNIVNQFELKYEALGNVDDTAGNGIKFYCEDALGGFSYITSAEGLYGEWMGIRKCDGNSTLIGVRLEVMPMAGNFNDDMGVTNMEMFCSGTGQVLNGLNGFTQIAEQKKRMQNKQHQTREFVKLDDGRTVQRISTSIKLDNMKEEPVYGLWLECDPGYSMCGLQTQIEPDHVVDDDAGLVNALFFCC